MAGKPVAIIMGSQSDWQTMKHAADTLAELGIDGNIRAEDLDLEQHLRLSAVFG